MKQWYDDVLVTVDNSANPPAVTCSYGSSLVKKPGDVSSISEIRMRGLSYVTGEAIPYYLNYVYDWQNATNLKLSGDGKSLSFNTSALAPENIIQVDCGVALLTRYNLINLANKNAD